MRRPAERQLRGDHGLEFPVLQSRFGPDEVAADGEEFFLGFAPELLDFGGKLVGVVAFLDVVAQHAVPLGLGVLR